MMRSRMMNRQRLLYRAIAIVFGFVASRACFRGTGAVAAASASTTDGDGDDDDGAAASSTTGVCSSALVVVVRYTTS